MARFQYVEENTKGKKRDLPISEDLGRTLDRIAAEVGVRFEVTSGGQPTEEEAGGKETPHRTGSPRHDHGGAADTKVYTVGKDGKKRYIRHDTPEGQKTWAAIVARGAAYGLTGIGAGIDYMGAETVHMGYGNEATWGGETGTPGWLKKAFQQGRAGKIPDVGTLNPYKPVPAPRIDRSGDGKGKDYSPISLNIGGVSLGIIKTPASKPSFRESFGDYTGSLAGGKKPVLPQITSEYRDPEKWSNDYDFSNAPEAPAKPSFYDRFMDEFRQAKPPKPPGNVTYMAFEPRSDKAGNAFARAAGKPVITPSGKVYGMPELSGGHNVGELAQAGGYEYEWNRTKDGSYGWIPSMLVRSDFEGGRGSGAPDYPGFDRKHVPITHANPAPRRTYTDPGVATQTDVNDPLSSKSASGQKDPNAMDRHSRSAFGPKPVAAPGTVGLTKAGYVYEADASGTFQQIGRADTGLTPSQMTAAAASAALASDALSDAANRVNGSQTGHQAPAESLSSNDSDFDMAPGEYAAWLAAERGRQAGA